MIEITCRALLFDLDGVLIDSTPAVGRVWSQWAEERGLDPAEVVAHADWVLGDCTDVVVLDKTAGMTLRLNG